MTPTYWPQHSNRLPDVLYFYITQGLRNYFKICETKIDLSSDHVPVMAMLDANPIQNYKQNYLYNKTTNWQRFSQLINQGTTLNIKLKSNDDIDSALSNFIEPIQSACKSSTKYNQSHDNTNNYVPIELRTLIKQVRAARRRWQTYRYPSLKTIYNKLHKKLKEEITLYKNKSFEQYLKSLNIKHNSLWFATKKLLKQTKEQSISN